MARNVEIKARAADFTAQSEIARTLAGGDPEIVHQEDVFFNVHAGWMKLRSSSPERAELISYRRPGRRGPKISEYEISPTQDPEKLKAVLASALGIIGTVVKTRHLYLAGRTRIHFDRVQSLGEFIELEVVLSDSDTPKDGEREARELMRQLGIHTDHLIDAAYIDMLGTNP